MRARGAGVLAGAAVLAGIAAWFLLTAGRESPPVQVPDSDRKSAPALPPQPLPPRPPITIAPQPPPEPSRPAAAPAPPTATPPPSPRPSEVTKLIPMPAAPGRSQPLPGTGTSRPSNPRLPTLEDLDAAAGEADKVSLMLRDFRTRMGSNPVGTNAEIMKAVMGDNPARARLGPPEGQSLNGQGELVDRWGSPYFFHQISGANMEIRSAGPDRVMWSGDDIVKH